MGPVGQLSDPYQQGEDDELGITISGLPGDLHDPDDPLADAVLADAAPGAADPAADTTADAAGGAAGAEAGDGDGDGDGDGVEYDLDDWSEIERQAIADRLREAGIPHGWEGTSLLVATVDEAAVENVLDIVEGEADPPLDDDRDRVAYDLSEWDDDQVAMLSFELREAGIAQAWEGDDLYVYAEDEQAVDDLFDRVAHPHELPAEDDDGAGPDGELLGEIFVAADRLRRAGDDLEGTVAMLDVGRSIDADAPPYGLGAPEWSHLCERVISLGELLAADTVDEDAVMDSARDLRTALRPFV
jgi:hypothetical protein